MGNFNSFVRRTALAGLASLTVGCALFRPSPEPAPAPAEGAESFTIPPDAAPAEPVITTTPAEAPIETAAAQPILLKETVPLRYVVKKGDTLWDISSHYLEDPWQWPELWYANPQVKNPHLIYPGDVLSLVWKNGRPRLEREVPPPIEALPPVAAETGEGVERLSPRIREIPLAEAIPAIPIEAVRSFLRGPRIVGRNELARAPYILEFADEHMMGASGNIIYVKNLPTGADYTYTVVRQGEAYRDPDDGALLGYEAIPVADAELREAGKPSVMRLDNSLREAQLGDRLLPAEAELFQANFYPHAPITPVRGRIISVFNGVSQIGQYQVVTLNRGYEHGLEPGHVLSIMQAGRKVRDPYGKTSEARERLPDLYAGTLMVFKVTPRVSYALVMKAVRSIHVLDTVELPRSSRGS